MAKKLTQIVDQRLLSHHPAGQKCFDVCYANGWIPENDDILRLVGLWSEVQEGRRREVPLSENHIRFTRFLIENKYLNEGNDEKGQLIHTPIYEGKKEISSPQLLGGSPERRG